MAAACLCPQCGAGLPKDAPQGLCPSCLLRSGLAANGSHSEGPNGTAGYHGPFVPPMVGDLARYFPQLEILELIGVGGMGAVYKARQSKLDRLVALKVLPPSMCNDPAFAERFTREARALARLCHPNVVAVHDFGEVEGIYFFLMEYVDGANLRHVLETGRLTPAEALRIVPQVCEALQYAHEEGIVHRDIKPENILLDQKGRVKVADFGLAKLVGPTPGVFTLTGSRQVVGTPHYMAPEQMEKPHTVDHRADIYSLGVVFYEMLTGELPLGRFAVPSQKAAVDGRLDDVVLRALAKEPDQRYQHVSEVKDGLDDVALHGKGPQAMTPRSDTGPPLCVPFVLMGSLSLQVTGLLRWDGTSLSMEMEINEITRALSLFQSEHKKTFREKEIPLADLHAIQLRHGHWNTWFLPRIELRSTRLNVFADIPHSSKGQLILYVTKHVRAEAAQLVAEVQARLARRSGPRQPVGVVREPAAQPEYAPAAPAGGFLGRRVHSLVQKARYWMVDSILLSRAAVPAAEPVAAGKEEAPPSRLGRLRGLLANTVGNSVLWGILLCLVGTATVLMPWSETRLSLFRVYTGPQFDGFPKDAGPQRKPPRSVTGYRTHSGETLEFPPDLTLQQVYNHVPELRAGMRPGFSYEEGVIVACLFGIMGLLLIGTSSLRSGGIWRALFLVPGAIAVIVLACEHIRRIGYTQSEVVRSISKMPEFFRIEVINPAPPSGVTPTEWHQLLDRLLAHWSLEAEFGPFVAIGLAVGLLLLGSWQLRQFFVYVMGDGAGGRPA